jgi:hypothetical protein
MAVFTISGSVQAGETYQVTLPASVATTEGGATLGASYSFSFQIKPADIVTGGGSYLSAQYRLDESTGTVAADSSPNHYDGTYKNGPLLAQTGAAAGTGTSAFFDGVDDYVELPRTYTLGILGDFTVTAWIRPDAVNGDRPIVGTDGYGPQQGLQLLVRNGTPYFGFYGDDTAGTRTISTGVWQHVTFRLHQGEQAIFVNGTLDVATYGHGTFAGLNPVLIGRWGGNSGTPKLYQGRIDDVQIYHRALTNTEIATLYAAPGSVNTAGLQNFPPVVNAGTDQTLDFPTAATLNGSVTDDGLPIVPGVATAQWTKVSGPGTVAFANAASAQTTVTFGAPGPYVLRLTGTDGDLTRTDDISIALLAGDLVAHYTLDEITGTFCADTSGNELHGTYTAGQTLGAAGIAGTAVEFNSTNIVSLGTPALLNGLVNNFTVSAWIRPTAIGGNRTIFGCNWQSQNGWTLRLSGGNLALERLGPSQLYNSGVAVSTNTWTHVAATYNADNSVTFFKNGVPIGTIAGTAPASPATRPWYIGGNGSGENVIGRLDDVQVYRRALTTNEVAFLYANPSQIVLLPTPFANWQTANGLSGNVPATDDGDHDGLMLLLEYALGGNPNIASTSPLPQSSVLGGRLAITFIRVLANTDITLTVQAADSLTGPWANLARSTTGGAFTALGGGVNVTETGAGATRNIEVRDLYLATDLAHPKRFMRVQVTKP